jgi:hypothetical protein
MPRDITMNQLRIVTAVCAFSLSIAQVNAEGQFLVHEGKAYAEIIISESPARSTRLVAAELQTYVAKISGARLPIGTEAEDGTLFIIYDHQRYTLNRAGKRGVASVQIAVFGEEDVHAGKPVTDKVRLQQVVTQLQNTDDTSGTLGN